MTSTIPVDRLPQKVAINRDGRLAYVTNTCGIDPLCGARATVSVIDISAHTVIDSIPVGRFANSGIVIAPDGHFVYVPNFDKPSMSQVVSVIDTASNTVTATIPDGRAASLTSIAITPDGAFLYVADYGSAVSVIDIASRTVTGTISQAGNGGIAFTSDGKFAYIAGGIGSSAVSLIDTATRTRTNRIGVGEGTFDVAIASAVPPSCAGDCDGDGAVTVNELVTGVNIALDLLSVFNCPALDTNHDGAVTIDEILTAVQDALNGCPAL